MRPNLVLITLDTVRADHLSCYGYEGQQTPAIDRIAAEGVLFDAAVGSGTWTLPSHASLFTGLSVSQHGARYNVAGRDGINYHRINCLGTEPSTLAEVLREKKYLTAGVGAGIWLNPKFGLARGFEHYEARVESWAGVPADEVTDSGIRLISKRRENQPFFLFLNYFDAHAPYAPPAGYHPDAVPDARSPNLVEMEINRDGMRLSEAESRQLRALYDGEIRFVDDQISRLWAHLEAEGLWEDTWIIITADHGESFGDHRFFGHGLRTWQDVIRVPLVMKLPAELGSSMGPGQVVSDAVQPKDCFPTIVASLGLRMPSGVEDVHLLDGTARRPVVTEAFRSYAAIRKFGGGFDLDERSIVYDGYKLIKRSDGSRDLYRLDEDPGELANLAPQESERVEQLSAWLTQWVRHSGMVTFDAPAASISNDDAERLRSLGYLD